MSEGKAPLMGGGHSKWHMPLVQFKMFLYVGIFLGLVVGLKFAGSLDLGTVSSIEHVATSLAIVENKAPEPAYVKMPIEDLNLKISSFEVCLVYGDSKFTMQIWAVTSWWLSSCCCCC